MVHIKFYKFKDIWTIALFKILVDVAICTFLDFRKSFLLGSDNLSQLLLQLLEMVDYPKKNKK